MPTKAVTRKRTPPTETQRNIRSMANAQSRVERVRTEEYGKRDIAHEQARLDTARHYPIERYKGQLVGRASDKVISTATPSADSGLIMTVIFTMAGLIIVYKLVTGPEQTSAFLNKTQNWLAAITTNQPLFKVVQK